MKPINWIAVKLEEAETLVDAVIVQAQAGDWRAAAWLFDRVYVKPQERVEVTRPLESKLPQDMTPAELDALLAKLLHERGEAAEEAGQA